MNKSLVDTEYAQQMPYVSRNSSVLAVLVFEHVVPFILISGLCILCAVFVLIICILSYYSVFGTFVMGAPRLLFMVLFAVCMAFIPPVIGIGTSIAVQQWHNPECWRDGAAS